MERKQGGEEPGDIDVVTFHRRPLEMTDAALNVLMMDNLNIFHPKRSKITYDCGAYYVDLGLEPEDVVTRTRYWFNPFSHRRITSEWKGMVQVPLNSPENDAAALTHLAPQPTADQTQEGARCP